MKTAFIFPGQGSQSVAMLNDIAEQFASIKDDFTRASEALGYDLWELVQQGPADKLAQTHITQPAILTASVALWNLLQEKGMAKPDYVAGHSLGEYSALVANGVLDFADAVKLVEKRGQFMQQAVPAGEGTMAAILGLTDQQVIDACKEAEQGEVVDPVNFNSPGQVVIAGNVAAIKRAIEICTKMGATKAIELSVSGPFHSQLMKPAAEQLAAEFEKITFKTPQIQLINNVDVAIENDIEAIKSSLIRQLYSPVRWTETVEKLHELGVEATVECGPGKVLSGLNRRIVKRMGINPVGELKGLEKFLAN